MPRPRKRVLFDPKQQSVRRNAAQRSAHANSTFNLDLAVAICEQVADGQTLKAICEAPGMPNRSTFRSWVIRNPDLRKAYEAARELQAHSLYDEAMGLTRILEAGKDPDGSELNNNRVNALRVALEQLRWAAGKLAPQAYGDKANPNGVIAIQINTPLNLGRASQDHDPITGTNLYSLKATIAAPNDPADTPAHDAVSGPSDPALPDGRLLQPPRPGDGG